MQEEFNNKIIKIKKLHKKDIIKIELIFRNYQNANIYIIVYYNKHDKCYYLSWYDLMYFSYNDITKYVSREYIPTEEVEQILEIFNNISLPVLKIGNEILNEELIIKCDNEIILGSYLPKDNPNLEVFIHNIFGILPGRLVYLRNKLFAYINNTNNSYEIYEPKKFDIFKSDLNILTNKDINNLEDIMFLEKINNSYYAVIAGKVAHAVIIDYDEKEGIARFFTTADFDYYYDYVALVIKGIRNNINKKFYKIRLKKEVDLEIEKYLADNFLLSLGIIDKYIYILSNNGVIYKDYVRDDLGEYKYEVLEDDIENTLTKTMREL